MTADQIKTEVARFWNSFSSRNGDALEQYYVHESSVFGSTSTRPEPGRLAAFRRVREYFHPQTTTHVTLGPIDVMILGDVAVATYTFELHARNVFSATGKTLNEDIDHGRATQVFAIDSAGDLRIVHEHLSVAAGT